MTTYTIPLNNGYEASIYIERSLQGARVHSLMFDDNADLTGETDSTQYMDYCHTEICAREILVMDPYFTNVWDYLATAGMPECPCD